MPCAHFLLNTSHQFCVCSLSTRKSTFVFISTLDCAWVGETESREGNSTSFFRCKTQKERAINKFYWSTFLPRPLPLPRHVCFFLFDHRVFIKVEKWKSRNFSSKPLLVSIYFAQEGKKGKLFRFPIAKELSLAFLEALQPQPPRLSILFSFLLCHIESKYK